jgi:hypothetical protein
MTKTTETADTVTAVLRDIARRLAQLNATLAAINGRLEDRARLAERVPPPNRFLTTAGSSTS